MNTEHSRDRAGLFKRERSLEFEQWYSSSKSASIMTIGFTRFKSLSQQKISMLKWSVWKYKNDKSAKTYTSIKLAKALPENLIEDAFDWVNPVGKF